MAGAAPAEAVVRRPKKPTSIQGSSLQLWIATNNRFDMLQTLLEDLTLPSKTHPLTQFHPQQSLTLPRHAISQQ